MDEAKRYLNNFSRVPNWNGIVNSNILSLILDISGGTVFCNGHLRTIEVTPIGDKFKISTKSF